jgi:4-hydroxy-3-polyprenylbenzoate decarboxylase
MTRPVIVGITGASGAAYGLALLDLLARLGVETHLVVTAPGAQVLEHETGVTLDQAAAKASRLWPIDDLFAPLASGSFLTSGMVVAPCSIRTLSAVACAHSGNLLERAADVTLKQRRPLVLMVRETPLHVGHLRLMTQAAEAGATIMPPVPAFYQRPGSVAEIVEATAARALDLLGLEHDLITRWGEGEGRR